MGIPTLILGESGTGKTFSCRNLDPVKVAMFQATGKPLPFKSQAWKESKSILVTSDWHRIIAGIKRCAEIGKQIVIIDDFQYLLAEEYLARSAEKGYGKFTELAVHARELIRAAQNAPENMRVYITWHTEIDDTGTIKAKTIGKLLNEKITIEGLFSIVIRSQRRDGEYGFSTQSCGDVCKSPYEMFDSEFISNDLKYVDERICEYYGIDTNTTQEAA